MFSFKRLSYFGYTLLIVCSLLIMPTNAWASKAYGVFMIVKGDVKVTSKGKTSSARVGLKIAEGDAVTTGPDARAKIVMSDKNVLNISPESKIEITEYKNDPTTNTKKVELKVDQGRLRANVEQKYDEDKNTFHIRTPTAVAGVRGTDFSVGFSPRTRKTDIVTFKGLVAVGKMGPTGRPEMSVLVRPGEKSEVEPGRAPASAQSLPTEELKKSDADTVADPADTVTPGASDTGASRETSSNEESSSSDPNASGEAAPSESSSTETASDSNAEGSKTQAAGEGSNTAANEGGPAPTEGNNSPSNTAPSAETSEPKTDKTTASTTTSGSREPAASSPPPPTSSGSMISAGDLAPDTAKSIAPPPPSAPLIPRIPTSTTSGSTQNLITETIRNQVTGKTKVKLEFNRQP